MHPQIWTPNAWTVQRILKLVSRVSDIVLSQHTNQAKNPKVFPCSYSPGIDIHINYDLPAYNYWNLQCFYPAMGPVFYFGSGPISMALLAFYERQDVYRPHGIDLCLFHQMESVPDWPVWHSIHSCPVLENGVGGWNITVDSSIHRDDTNVLLASHCSVSQMIFRACCHISTCSFSLKCFFFFVIHLILTYCLQTDLNLYVTSNETKIRIVDIKTFFNIKSFRAIVNIMQA